MEAEMGAPAFWNNPERAQKHIAKLNNLKKTISGLVAFNKRLDDAAVTVELIESPSPAEQETHSKEINGALTVTVDEAVKLEVPSFPPDLFSPHHPTFILHPH